MTSSTTLRRDETSVDALRVARAPAWLPPVTLLVVVVLLTTIPVLRTPDFYYWDDSAAAFLPTWRAIGLDLMSGQWPTLRPDLWMGGNWAGEAQFGLWSPVNLLLYVVVAALPDLAVAAAVVKITFLVVLAFGTYMLARDYGALPWPAVAAASALPVSGFTLYFDASTWAAGLMAFAWVPWFWWAARRTLHRRVNPAVVFVIGYLLITNGNPYGALAAVIVLAGVAVEGLATGQRTGLMRLVLIGACVGTAAGVAYLPLVLTAESGWRDSGGIYNDGFLVPDLTMLATTSMPSYLPFIRVWSGSGSTVPVTYSAWFVVPLLAWLPWRVLVDRAREFAGLGVILAVYLGLTLGPSSLWLFRWPARLIEYVLLCVFLVVAVLLSSGLRTDHWRIRAGVTYAAALASAWLAVAARPDLYLRHVGATVVMLALVSVLVVAILRAPRAVPLILVGGTGLVLVLQTAWVPDNRDVAVWSFPTAERDLDRYAGRFQEPVLQIAASELVPAEDRPQAWDDLRFGSLAAASGVETSASYTGVGYDEFSETLCMNHTGSTCAEALLASRSPAGEAVTVDSLADAVKARTIVVQNDLVPEEDRTPPDGWTVAESTERVTVFTRSTPLPWPDSRLAAVTAGVSVDSAGSTDTTESLRLSTPPDGGALLFSRLAWPGYSASADGIDLEVVETSEGLTEVLLPGGLDRASVTLTFRVPGYPLAIPLLLLGVAGATTISLAARRADRRARPHVGLGQLDGYPGAGHRPSQGALRNSH